MRGKGASILAGPALLLVLVAGLWTGMLRPPGAGIPSRSGKEEAAATASTLPQTAAPGAPERATAPVSPAETPPSTHDPESPTAGPDPLLQTSLPPAEALRRLDLCGQMAGADPSASFEDAWRWLGEEAAQLERKRHAQSRAWLVERCGPWTLAPASERAQQLKAELLRRAARSADLGDQLRALEFASAEPSAADAVAVRRQLEAALADGRPELLRDIGRVLERSRYRTPELLGPYAGGGASSLFTLLACDLGMPCGADSEPVRLNCALRGVCGYADYETMFFDAFHGMHAAQILQQHRALLLARIRAGQIRGLFDPVPLPPKP